MQNTAAAVTKVVVLDARVLISSFHDFRLFQTLAHGTKSYARLLYIHILQWVAVNVSLHAKILCFLFREALQLC